MCLNVFIISSNIWNENAINWTIITLYGMQKKFCLKSHSRSSLYKHGMQIGNFLQPSLLISIETSYVYFRKLGNVISLSRLLARLSSLLSSLFIHFFENDCECSDSTFYINILNVPSQHFLHRHIISLLKNQTNNNQIELLRNLTNKFLEISTVST